MVSPLHNLRIERYSCYGYVLWIGICMIKCDRIDISRTEQFAKVEICRNELKLIQTESRILRSEVSMMMYVENAL